MLVNVGKSRRHFLHISNISILTNLQRSFYESFYMRIVNFILFIYLFIYLFVYLFIYLFIYLFFWESRSLKLFLYFRFIKSSQMFFKTGVLKCSAIFTRNYLCRSLFNKVALKFSIKKRLQEGIFLWIFWNWTPVAAFDLTLL